MTRIASDEIIEEIRQCTDIVDVISEYVVLNRKGKNHVGLCPFHSEKTPSFTVNPDAQMFYCFGCGSGGNVYSFLMRYHGLSFPETVKTLADRAGIQLPAEKVNTPAERRQEQEKQRLYELNLAACKFFHAVLCRHPAGEKGRQYLRSRKINTDAVKSFMLGFSPEGWDYLTKYLIKKGFSEGEIVSSGAAQRTSRGKLCDRFRGRLIFPIFNFRGQVIGFGGRAVGKEEPKYLNTSETPIFRKRDVLYGLNTAIAHIRSKGWAVVVEGYTDVIAAHQSGIQNTVAPLGTAFTEEQGRMLKRYTDNIVIAFDSDSAGAAAAIRGMEMLIKCGCKVRVAPIPQGEDPDSLIRSKGKDAFIELLERKSLSLVEYKLQQACINNNIDSISGRVAVVNDLLPTLAKIRNAVERREYVRLISLRLDIPDEAILQELSKHTEKLQKNGIARDKIVKNSYTRERISIPGRPKFQGPEHILAWCAVNSPELLEAIEEELGTGAFEEAYLQEIIEVVKEIGGSVSGDALINRLLSRVSGEAQAFLMEMKFKDYLPTCYSRDEIKGYLRNYKRQSLDKKIKLKQEELSRVQNDNDGLKEKQCLEEIRELLRLREEI